MKIYLEREENDTPGVFMGVIRALQSIRGYVKIYLVHKKQFDYELVPALKLDGLVKLTTRLDTVDWSDRIE